MIAWLPKLVEFLRALPTIIATLYTLKKTWESMFPLKDRKEKLAQFNEALKKGRETGDFSDATKLFLGDEDAANK